MKTSYRNAVLYILDIVTCYISTHKFVPRNPIFVDLRRTRNIRFMLQSSIINLVIGEHQGLVLNGGKHSSQISRSTRRPTGMYLIWNSWSCGHFFWTERLTSVPQVTNLLEPGVTSAPEVKGDGTEGLCWILDDGHDAPA